MIMRAEHPLNGIFKILFAFVFIYTQRLLNIDKVAAVPEDGKTEKNDVRKEGNDMERFLEEELPWFSLGCVLFKDLGCDSECFVIADAFGHLGLGVCVDDYWCDCGYAMNPTLKGIWEQKFPQSDKILNQIIESNDKVANNIHIILAQGFRTTKQSKDDLKPYLSDEQFTELQSTDTATIPADKFIKSSSEYNLDEMLKHVNEKLPIALKWRDADLNAVRAKYKPRLIQVLNNARGESYSELKRIVHLVRRVNNETLNIIVDKYLTRNNIRVNPEHENITGIDKISYIVVNELVKRVDKGAIQIAVGWVRSKATSLLNKFRTTDNDRFISEVLAAPGPISHDWRKDGTTIRYRRTHRGDVNFAWFMDSISNRVCIFRSVEDAVSQSWMFDEKVIINLFRSPKGSFAEYWKFGSLSYQHHDAGPSEGVWSNGEPIENILKEYKKRIDEWCGNYNNLVEKNFCIIYKNI